MTTLDLQIASGANDADERDDNTSFSSSRTSIICDSNTTISSRINGGMRFQNLTIPPGSTINVAYCSIRATNTSSDDPNVDIFAEAADNPADFSTTADVTGRTRSTANVQWTATGIGTGEVNSPSIVTVIQEIINRGGWASGNALVVFFDGRSDANATFRMTSYDGTPANSPKLHIEYTAPPSEVHQLSMMRGFV